MSKQKLASGMALLLFVMLALACGREKKAIKEEISQEPLVTQVSIGGMSCTGCEETIQNAVGKLEGIKSVKASYKAGNAIIEFFPDMVDTVKISEAISGSGYTVVKFTNQ